METPRSRPAPRPTVSAPAAPPPVCSGPCPSLGARRCSGARHWPPPLPARGGGAFQLRFTYASSVRVQPLMCEQLEYARLQYKVVVGVGLPMQAANQKGKRHPHPQTFIEMREKSKCPYVLHPKHLSKWFRENHFENETISIFKKGTHT
jgi:hypothetical protein